MIIYLKNFSQRILARVMLFTLGTALSIILFLSAFVGFLLVAKYVFLDKKEEFDRVAFTFIHSFKGEILTKVMAFVTVFGNYQAMIVANILLTCFFYFIVKHKWYSVTIPSVALGGVIIMSLLKVWFNRPRPLSPLLEPARGLSFPSGHAMCSVTFFGLIIYFLWKKYRTQPRGIAAIVILAAFTLLIGISRIYLRVHYASDVLAGFAAGIIWLTLAITTLRKVEKYTKKEVRQVPESSPTNSSL